MVAMFEIENENIVIRVSFSQEIEMDSPVKISQEEWIEVLCKKINLMEETMQ
ncbi:MAG: hypothetical protein ACI4TK_03065 [Agathobacter sp.]